MVNGYITNVQFYCNKSCKCSGGASCFACSMFITLPASSMLDDEFLPMPHIKIKYFFEPGSYIFRLFATVCP